MFNREHQNGSDRTPTARWLTVWEEEGTYGERVLTQAAHDCTAMMKEARKGTGLHQVVGCTSVAQLQQCMCTYFI